LIKLIDATANLSIQVHPGAGGAADALGKTEAWYILAAEPEALLYAGLRRDAGVEQFAAACARANGEAAAHLRQIRAHPGSTLLIPAGTAHAIGAGVVLYEIQQPFDLTLRLDDWGRRDASGATRELQLKEGLAALAPESRPDVIEAVGLDGPAGQCHLLVACRFFALERIALAEGEQVDLTVEDGTTPQVLTSIHGAGAVRAGGREVAPRRDAAVVLLAGCGVATLTATEELVALRAWVPD
jgi:mannose-6-phosphate isomerase